MSAPQDSRCSICNSAVPAGAFCAYCGAAFAGSRSRWRMLLRPNAYAVCPRQLLGLPLVTSSLFPHLAATMRRPFRHGLFLVLGALLVFSMLKWLAPLVIVVSLGIPLLFALYVWQSGVFRDVPRTVLMPAMGFAAAISAAWWVWSGALVARQYDIPVVAGSQLLHELALGLTVTVVGIGLMLAPILVVKVFHRTLHESLDGFVIGAACALAYSAAGTLAWLAPQFTFGLIDNYAAWRLFEEAFLYGFADPITAAVVGGMVGLRLWFRPGRNPADARAVRRLLDVLALAAIAIYVGIYLVDAAETSRFVEVAANTVLTALSLMTLRTAIQVVLLHEDAEPGTGRDVACEDCGRTVPDRPFCPGCGAAARATSRSARALRLGAVPLGDSKRLNAD